MKWILGYKDSQGQWRAFSKTYWSKLPEKINALKEFYPGVEQICIRLSEN